MEQPVINSRLRFRTPILKKFLAATSLGLGLNNLLVIWTGFTCFLFQYVSCLLVVPIAAHENSPRRSHLPSFAIQFRLVELEILYLNTHRLFFGKVYKWLTNFCILFFEIVYKS